MSVELLRDPLRHQGRGRRVLGLLGTGGVRGHICDLVFIRMMSLFCNKVERTSIIQYLYRDMSININRDVRSQNTRDYD